MKEYDVIIIGGGITGAGTARDCAMRGLKTLLLEKFDLTNGATGRNHGLLHSGARYAVNDSVSAAECARENLIIKNIAPGCVDPCGGLFVSLTDEDLEYQEKLLSGCRASGIDAEVLAPSDALVVEPCLNPAILSAVWVPDASVDPFRLTTLNVLDARIHGAEICTYSDVVGFLSENGRVVGVRVLDSRSGEMWDAGAQVVVNAAGIWAGKVAALAGASIKLLPSKGSLIIFGNRVNRMVVNHCRKPSDGDILVPGGIVSVLGTTSSKVGIDECDSLRVTAAEVDSMLDEGCNLVPSLSDTRIIRAYSGVRPLIARDEDPTGRNTSRGIVLLDHERLDGIPGFVSICGGKLTTYRLMAELTTDLVCRKMHVRRKCRTAGRQLPGTVRKPTDAIHDRALSHDSEVLCKCEHVTRAEIAYAVKYLGVRDLIELRRRTRVGMGSCQGSFCIGKVAAALAEEMGCPERTDELMRQYISERWKGMEPVCWGEAMRQAEYMRNMYGK